MITLRTKYRLKISNSLAAIAALLLLLSSMADPASLAPAQQSGTPASQLADSTTYTPAESVEASPQPQAENSTLEEAMSGIASAVGQSSARSLRISSLIFRF